MLEMTRDFRTHSLTYSSRFKQSHSSDTKKKSKLSVCYSKDICLCYKVGNKYVRSRYLNVKGFLDHIFGLPNKTVFPISSTATMRGT